MQLHNVTATLDAVVIKVPGSTRVVDRFTPPEDGFEIHVLNDLLWQHGWSVAGPWKTAGRSGRMHLTTVALKRG